MPPVPQKSIKFSLYIISQKSKGINYVVLTLDIIGLKYTGGEASFLPFIDPPIMCNEFAPTISRRVMGVPCCMIPIGLVGVSGVLYKTGKDMRIPQYTMKS